MDQVIRGTIFKNRHDTPVIVFDDMDSSRLIVAKLEELNAEETAEVFKNIINDRAKERNQEDFSGSSEDR